MHCQVFLLLGIAAKDDKRREELASAVDSDAAGDVATAPGVPRSAAVQIGVGVGPRPRPTVVLVAAKPELGLVELYAAMSEQAVNSDGTPGAII